MSQPTPAPVHATTDITFRIRRFNPEIDSEPHWEDYVVPCYPTDRILDALAQIKGPLSDLRFSTTKKVSGVAVPPSIAVRPARVAFR